MDEGDLRLVREFVNTRDIEAGTDALATLGDLSRWLRERDLIGAGDVEAADDAGGADDLTVAVALREAIRELLEVNHDGATGPSVQAAAAALTDAAAALGLRVRFTADGSWRLTPTGTGVPRALGQLIATITGAMSAGTWRRLKVCRNDRCRWAFFDSSRSGAGKWCSMAVCGNRNKARAWRARQRVSVPGDGG